MSSLIICDGIIAKKSIYTNQTTNGSFFTTFTLAISNGKDANGDYNPSTFMPIKFKGRPTGLITEGEKVLLYGFLTTEKWTDKEGNERQKTSIFSKLENIIAHNFEDTKQFYETVRQLYSGLKPNLDDFEL